MCKKLFLMFLLSLATLTGSAQKKYGLYAVAFYNVENLFDTIHDEGKNDYEYLPNGGNHWNAVKYENKLKNLSRVLTDLGTDKLPGVGAAVVGISEVENARALDDLVGQPAMKERGFKYVHIEGPDKRGVDCALLYNPKFFTPEKAFLPQYIYENGDTVRKTRGFLTVQGRLAGDPLTVIVCHWPSRFATGYFRDIAGKQVRQLTDSIRQADPEQRIIVMGDMNDDPDNTSMAKMLGARRKMKDVGEGDFFNPWWDVLRSQGQGTLSYQGGWNLFDQIVLSRNLLDPKGRKDYRHLTLYNWHIFRRDYLMQQEGKYKGAPLRTHAAGVWLNGYSDHLPTVTYLIKEMK
ncbi:MAG: endonuclease/exonuclease/phosphatase family protein [Bacteroidaceae bacterium]|nr:endonuclease/exonuclease/phosphatase family protein [Bacteroidaceae bacterium]MDE7166232.1 endonuclease/exonuclease/phosphatase family protein [Bacteroidaceae bacterium]